MKNILEVKNFSLEISTKKILQDISFLIHKGDKAVLQAPSGKGKTTLLKSLAGFYSNFQGEIFFLGKNIKAGNISFLRNNIAWLPQSFDFERTKVKDIFSTIFSFKINKNKKPSRQKIENLFETLLLKKDLLNSKLENLSGGEKQRVALCIVYLLNKTLIILDEPSSSLDNESASKVMELFLQNKELTILSTSHNEDWISMCNKKIIL